MRRLLVITQAVDVHDRALGFFHRWIELFAEQYDHVLVVCLHEGEHHLPKNVEVISLGKERGLGRLHFIRQFLYTIWSRRANYDQVFVHMNPIYLVLGGWLFRLLNKRVVLWYTHRHVDAKLRIGVFFANVVATVSKQSMGIDTPKKVPTGHGVDTATFAGMPSAQPPTNIVVVGRISSIKGILETVEVIAQVRKHIPGVTVTFIGEPVGSSDLVYQEAVKSRVQVLDLGDAVTWRGGVSASELPKLYREYGLLLSLSSTGSFDKVLLEAMASGLLVCTPNQAFKGHISDRCIIDEQATDLVAETTSILEALIRLPETERTAIQEQLIQYVVTKHGLQSLILRLSGLLGATPLER